VYSTYLDGTFGSEGFGREFGYGIAVDGSGDAYVVGDANDFGEGQVPAFVTEINAGGTALMYGADLGSSIPDGYGIAVDSSGNAYVTGTTQGGLPTTSGAFQPTYGGGYYSAFVAKLTAVASTTTTLTDTGPNPSTNGQAVGFTATVSGGSDTDGETVLIEDASNGNAVVATPTLSGGTATFTICELSVGTHDLFAIYNGDDYNGGSESSAVTQVVNAAPPPGITAVVINQDISALYNAAGQPSPGVQRSMVDDIVYTFNEPVNILDPGTDPNVFTVAVAAVGPGPCRR
jgi:Bacterial Ig-like domain (group 3)/Beta-propeller repeat